MDTSFTSLTCKKGPSRQECSQFITKFKTAVMNSNLDLFDNSENRPHEIEHRPNGTEQRQTEGAENRENPANIPSTSTKRPTNSFLSNFRSYRIRIDNDYVITINRGRKGKREKSVINSTSKLNNNEQEDNQSKNENIVNESAGNLPERNSNTQTHPVDTAMASEETNIVNEKQNESDNIKHENSDIADTNTPSKSKAEKQSEEDVLLSVSLGSNSKFRGNIQLEPNANMTRKGSIQKGEELEQVEKKNFTDLESGNTVDTFDSDEQKLNVNTPPVERTLEENTFSCSCQTNHRPDSTSTEETEQDESTMEAISCLLEFIAFNNFSSFQSYENHPFKNAKQELNKLLMASASRVGSDSVFRVLCNILEELHTIRPVSSKTTEAPSYTESTSTNLSGADTSRSSDSKMVLLANKYYVVNMDQIKSMAAVMERINKVLSTLIKYFNDNGEMVAQDSNRESCNSISENKETKESSTNDNHAKEFTINVVEIVDKPIAMTANQTREPSELSVDPQSMNTDSCQSTGCSLLSTTLQGSNDTMEYALHSLNSLSSPASCQSNVLLRRKLEQRNADDEGERLFCDNQEHFLQGHDSKDSPIFKRKRSQFRASRSRSSHTSNPDTTQKLLSLLDKVEKLLINNCADRYEMMILLEQIFTDYAKSARKTVMDLTKFVVTFNKNNLYL